PEERDTRVLGGSAAPRPTAAPVHRPRPHDASRGWRSGHRAPAAPASNPAARSRLRAPGLPCRAACRRGHRVAPDGADRRLRRACAGRRRGPGAPFGLRDASTRAGTPGTDPGAGNALSRPGRSGTSRFLAATRRCQPCRAPAPFVRALAGREPRLVRPSPFWYLTRPPPPQGVRMGGSVFEEVTGRAGSVRSEVRRATLAAPLGGEGPVPRRCSRGGPEEVHPRHAP